MIDTKHDILIHTLTLPFLIYIYDTLRKSHFLIITF